MNNRCEKNKAELGMPNPALFALMDQTHTPGVHSCYPENHVAVSASKYLNSPKTLSSQLKCTPPSRFSFWFQRAFAIQ